MMCYILVCNNRPVEVTIYGSDKGLMIGERFFSPETFNFTCWERQSRIVSVTSSCADGISEVKIAAIRSVSSPFERSLCGPSIRVVSAV